MKLLAEQRQKFTRNQSDLIGCDYCGKHTFHKYCTLKCDTRANYLRWGIRNDVNHRKLTELDKRYIIAYMKHVLK